MDMVGRFDVYWTRLDPTLGSEIRKTRPAVVISHADDIARLSTVIIAPLTSTIKTSATRVNCQFHHRAGSIVLDQIRAVDKVRLHKKMGTLEPAYQKEVLAKLQQMFS